MRARLVLLVLASVAPLLVLSVATLWSTWASERERSAQATLQIARGGASAVDRELGRGLAGLQALALSVYLQRGDLDGFRSQAQRFVDQQHPGALLILADGEGRQLVNTSIAPGQPLPMRRNVDVVRTVFETGRPAVTNVFPGSVASLAITLDVPVLRDGRVVYDLALSPRLERFAEIIGQQRPDADWVVSVVDADGVNVARVPNGDRFVGVPLSSTLRPHYLARAEGVLHSTSLEGTPLLTVFSRETRWGWGVAIGRPRAEIDAPLRRSLGWLAGLGSLLLLGALGLALGLTRSIGGPIARLGEFARRSHDLPDAVAPAPRTGLAEVDAVAEAFGDAVRGLRASEARVRDGEALLASVIDAIPGVVFAKDLDGRYLVMNEAGTRVHGTPWRDAIGRTDTQIYGTESAPMLRANDAAALAAGTPLVSEESTVDPQGRHIWFQSIKAPLRDAHGAVLGVVGISIDITDRKAAEERLRASEARLRAVQETSIDGFMILAAVRDARGSIVDFEWLDANEAAERILGRPAGWFRGRRLLAETPGDADGARYRAFVRVVETGESWVHEFAYARGDDDLYLRLAAARIDDGFAVTITDLSERERLHAAERRASEALREADRRKDEFLAMLAHELRNPLAPAVNAIRLLQSHEVLSEIGKRAVAMLDRQTNQMRRLVDDLLEVSRITRGTIEIRPESVTLHAAVAQAVEAALPAADRKSQTVTMALAERPVRVRADPVRLAQILENLLGNAIKYTPVDGTIHVEVADRTEPGGPVTIRVTDTGIGIAPEQLEAIFELFVQAEPGVGEFQGGLGIGLAMVRRLVALHGGQVSAQSAGRGRGASFVVRWPADDTPIAAGP